MKNQPKGIIALASTEMWERFSFYTMQFSLVLYATATVAKGGLGFDDTHALRITGIYGGLVYATPVLGGYVADKWLGRRNAVMVGGLLMAMGHFVLAMGGVFHFYLSLLFLASGCGLLKPNITSLVGDLFDKGDEKREAGYNIFYAGINVGAFLSGIVGGVLNERIGFYASFLAAGCCMIVAILNFRLTAFNTLKLREQHVSATTNTKKIKFSALKETEKKDVYLFVGLCIMNVVWQIAYNQWAGSLNLLAQNNTDRFIAGFHVPVLWFESLNSFFIITLSPLFALLYIALQKRNKKISLSLKLSLGYFLMSAACLVILPAVLKVQTEQHYLTSPLYQVGFYFLSTLSELFTMPVMFSAASLLAPKGYEGRLTGFFVFTGLAMGNYLAGFTSSFFTKRGDAMLFLSLSIVTCAFGLVHILLNKKISMITEKARV